MSPLIDNTVMAIELNVITTEEHRLLFMGRTKDDTPKALYLMAYENNQFSLSISVGFKQVYECDDIEEAINKYNEL